MRIIKYIIPRKYNNEKISTFLKDKGYSSKNLTVMRRTEGAIVLNGCKVYMNRLLQDGDDLTISIPEEKKSEKIVPVNLPIEIVYEDEDILVVNKPPFMPTHPSLNNYENTLANALAYYYKKKYPQNAFVFRCINRLDRDTSGLTIIAKHMVSASILHQQVIDDVIKRTYYAIVEEKEGEAIKDEGVIDLPIGRQNDSSITRCVDMENGQRAVTHYKIISRGEGYELLLNCAFRNRSNTSDSSAYEGDRTSFVGRFFVQSV